MQIARPPERSSMERPRGAARDVAKAIMEHSASILSALALRVGLRVIKLLDCANGSKKQSASS